ncbi:Hypothetical predicted protein [Pelobates cultripes]|uniref:Uncharacterized protein n=1 Tax=Pelobates cultripes TaxID=61616 RepID=A0AAD1SSS3_PELCU|nr:Hypothetical predicted protein [Pelobates cultripes]
MATAKTKKFATKAEKMSFFGQKSQPASETTRAAAQDGAEDSDTTMPHTDQETSQPAEYLTKGFFEKSMEGMAKKLISTWQTTTEQIKREVMDLSARTTSVEQHYEELSSAQGDLTQQLKALQCQMEHMEARVVDQEDRARRNNLRLRGVPETILPDDLPIYVQGLLRAYAPDIPTDIKADPHEDYSTVRIMADISTATLRRRQEFLHTTTELRTHGIRYRWGFPTKIILTKNGKTVQISTPEEGKKMLASWGLDHNPTMGARPESPRASRRTNMD